MRGDGFADAPVSAYLNLLYMWLCIEERWQAAQTAILPNNNPLCQPLESGPIKSNVQIGDVERIFDNEIAAWFHHIAH